MYGQSVEFDVGRKLGGRGGRWLLGVVRTFAAAILGVVVVDVADA
jgi:hypothetical protein